MCYGVFGVYCFEFYLDCVCFEDFDLDWQKMVVFVVLQDDDWMVCCGVDYEFFDFY